MNTISPVQPRFSGLGQAVARGVSVLEGTQSYAHSKFFQDTASVWAPRAAASRSLPELSEVTLLEFIESAIVYYAVGFLGRRVFANLFSGKHVDKALLTKPLKEIPTDKLAKVVPAKAAMIMASVGVAAFAGEYALNFAKNLFTAKAFRKDDFTDVVNLSDGKMHNAENSETVQKAKKRIAMSFGIAGGIVGLAALLARHGRGSNKVLQKLVKTFDFTYEKGKFALTRNQLMVYMGVAAISYLDAARNRLERLETATRLPIVFGFLLFGAEAVQKRLTSFFQKRGYGELFKQVDGKAVVKTVKELTTEAAKQGKKVDKKLLAAKNKMFLIPQAISVLGIGLGTSLVNRVFTRLRYEKQQAEQAQTHTSGHNRQQFDSYFGSVMQQRQQRHEPAFHSASRTTPFNQFYTQPYRA